MACERLSRSGEGFSLNLQMVERFCGISSLINMANHLSDKRMILVVDDEVMIRQVLSDILSGLGFEVVTAEGGEEALRCFGQHAFSLTMTDRNMSGMAGEELAELLRQRSPAHPVILMSGMSPVARTNFPVGFLPKPFSRAAVTAAVRSALGDAALSG
jgi:CheY-like chemotaxis protein